MKKNIKFILLLVFIAIVAGFSGYLMKKNNLNDELIISDPTDISTESLFNANIMDRLWRNNFFFQISRVNGY
jgi:hypothetical protein